MYRHILTELLRVDNLFFTGVMGWLTWALFVLLSTLVCCQPTELILAFFQKFSNFTPRSPPLSGSASTASDAGPSTTSSCRKCGICFWNWRWKFDLFDQTSYKMQHCYVSLLYYKRAGVDGFGQIQPYFFLFLIVIMVYVMYIRELRSSSLI